MGRLYPLIAWSCTVESTSGFHTEAHSAEVTSALPLLPSFSLPRPPALFLVHCSKDNLLMLLLLNISVPLILRGRCREKLLRHRSHGLTQLIYSQPGDRTDRKLIESHSILKLEENSPRHFNKNFSGKSHVIKLKISKFAIALPSFSVSEARAPYSTVPGFAATFGRRGAQIHCCSSNPHRPSVPLLVDLRLIEGPGKDQVLFRAA